MLNLLEHLGNLRFGNERKFCDELNFLIGMNEGFCFELLPGKVFLPIMIENSLNHVGVNLSRWHHSDLKISLSLQKIESNSQNYSDDKKKAPQRNPKLRSFHKKSSTFLTRLRRPRQSNQEKTRTANHNNQEKLNSRKKTRLRVHPNSHSLFQLEPVLELQSDF